MFFSIKSRKIVDWLFDANSSIKEDVLIEKIKAEYQNLSDSSCVIIKESLCRVFLPHYKSRMRRLSYKKDDFMKKCNDFLENDFLVDLSNCKKNEGPSKMSRTKSTTQNRRSILSYVEVSDRTTRSRAQDLSNSNDFELLKRAYQIKTKQNNQIKGVRSTRVRKLKRIIVPTNMHLANYMNSDFTKRKWNSSRKSNLIIYGSYLWPSYSQICDLKKNCYPDSKYFNFSSSGASVDLQASLDHTTERIFSLLDEKQKNSLKNKYLAFNWKGGMDGSSSQREFQQKVNEENKINNDNSSSFNEEETYEDGEFY